MSKMSCVDAQMTAIKETDVHLILTQLERIAAALEWIAENQEKANECQETDTQ